MSQYPGPQPGGVQPSDPDCNHPGDLDSGSPASAAVLAYADPGVALPPSNPLAIASVIVAALGIPATVATLIEETAAIGLLLGLVIFPLAIPCAIVALRRARQMSVPGRFCARLGLLLGIAALLGWLIAVSVLVSRVYESAIRTQSYSHLRAIAASLMLYAQDNGGRFPQHLDQLISEGYRRPEEFICPSSSDIPATGPTTQAIVADFQQPGRCSYLYVGAGLTTAASPATILACERPGNHRKKGLHILYADGTVDWHDAIEAQYILNELKAGFNPPRPATQPASPAAPRVQP